VRNSHRLGPVEEQTLNERSAVAASLSRRQYRDVASTRC